MFFFLIPLLLGFTLNVASAFTTAWSRRWGERRGRQVTALLRNVLGIPVWVVGLALAIRTPSPALFPASPVAGIAGWVLLVAGCSVIGLALAVLRSKAAAPSTSDALVERGLYRRVRHPIHAGMFLVWIALPLMHPRAAVGLACAIGICWTLAQTRAEELDLLQRLPAYADYMRRVPRFLPRPRPGEPPR